jgi:hypothetical protein
LNGKTYSAVLVCVIQLMTSIYAQVNNKLIFIDALTVNDD